MHLVFANAESTSINATLNADEHIGNIIGPIEFSVPVDLRNAEYADIQARELRIDPFVPPPPPMPEIISRRQFFQASAGKGMITQKEALDAVRHGEIPALMQQGLDNLTPDEKFAAEMLLSGAGEFERSHPLVEKFAEVMGMPPAALDEMWRYAATL